MPDISPVSRHGPHIVDRLMERYGIAIRMAEIPALGAAARRGLLLHRHRHREDGQLVETRVADWGGRAVVCVLVGEALDIRTVVTPQAPIGGRKRTLRFRACQPKRRGKPKGSRRWKPGRRPRVEDEMEDLG